MAEKVTLKQIAEQAGVSLTTVHRVLNNKGGCSEALKQKILAIAKEQGYTINLVASSLRKQTRHIALVIPSPNKDFRYFGERVLDGYFQFRNEVSQFNVVFQECYIQGKKLADVESNTLATLKNIYRDHPTHFDGVVIYGLVLNEAAIMMVNRIVGSGTQVIVLERMPSGLSDISSVTINDQLAGNLAGELLAKCVHTSGTVAILEQELHGGDQNGAACMESLAKYRPDLRVRPVELELGKDQSAMIAQLISSTPDLVGIYSTSARHTVSLLQAVQRTSSNNSLVLIGSELFEESYQALQNGILDAVLDKRPFLIGYKAAQFLFCNLVKSAPLPNSYKVAPRIVLRANSDLYYDSQDEF